MKNQIYQLVAFVNAFNRYTKRWESLHNITKVYVGKPVNTGLDRNSSKEEIADKSVELMDIVYNLPEVYRDK